MALSEPSWLGFFFFFPHLAVRLSQSRSPGAMTVWHPIIPLSLIVLLHAPCASFNLSLKARCTANVLYLAWKHSRQSVDRREFLFLVAANQLRRFSLCSVLLLFHTIPKRAQSDSVSEAWFTFISTSEINMEAPTESNNHSHSCSDQ